MFKNIFKGYFLLILSIIVFVFCIFIFCKTIEENRVKIVENKEYGFDIKLDKKLFFSGKEDFIKVSNEKIGKNLLDNQCVINISSEKSFYNVCDYIKNECLDFECEKYICEKYYEDWYKTVEYGNFFGTDDIILGYKNKDFIYFLNLECNKKENDNLNNPLFLEIIKGIKINK